MLKRLELVGFKSFADKTQFDFTMGITGLVGPNGSGKSNVVDAVRWILGEQSAKSLRGGEMADVIFNGSTTRRSLGLAEVTMTFDNSRKALNTELDEVQITRRVYRNGEGEYLLNQQPCRLKDIKDLLLGSGAGSSAYCIIQQGQVDALLQASTKERRTIFEEAAGISRFKAKKLETLRKLERVDQNLQRLKDIIDEVDKQLRSVKLQASKAQRYQEYSQRLKELRVGQGLEDYHELSGQLTAEQATLDGLRGELSRHTDAVQASETAARQLDEAVARLDEEVHAEEARLSQARQQIAAAETTLSRERALSAELEADLSGQRLRLGELNAHLTSLAASAASATADCTEGERQAHEQRQMVRQQDEELQRSIVRLANLQRQIQADKSEHIDLMWQAARLHNDTNNCQKQVETLKRERERLQLRETQATEFLATLDQELKSLTDAESSLLDRLNQGRRDLEARHQRRSQLGDELECTGTRLTGLHAGKSGLISRIEVLDRLEQSQEGLGAGVREVLELLRTGVWSRELVPGMLAEFLTAGREHAPLIDLALAEREQCCLVRDLALLAEQLASHSFSSRVSFVPIRATETMTLPPRPSEGAWAVDLVSCEHAEFAGLPVQFLGDTWIVADLSTARRLHSQAPGLRFVTHQGELLEPDGTLTVGTHHPEAGILSRKSELRELRQQVQVMEADIAATDQQVAGLREQLAAVDRESAALQQLIHACNDESAGLRTRIGQHQERRAGVREDVELSRTERSGINQEIEALELAWQQAKAKAEEMQQRVAAVQARLDQADQELRAKEEQRQQQQQENTAAKVTLAQLEERLRSLRARRQQAEADLAQRRHEQEHAAQQLQASRARWQESQRAMLQASTALGWWYLEKEDAQRRVAGWMAERDQRRQERQALADTLQTAQSVWREQQEQAHARELAVSDIRHRRDSLADRLRDDYQLELAELYQQRLQPDQSWQPSGVEPAAAAGEIEELKRKLGRLGSVNLDALQELTELESRAHSLQAQYDDLTTAQKSLQEIIAKINQDSRKLFSDTFTAIRGHFQELFRKLFGGGMADIVLEDENDILDCGIEIVARPPGKELRSISLMSGGEKTMTAVALLLAIFRSKPGPFCVLDEVDAALDEANIDRFTSVLREFLDRSHFIIVTHSKKTMACADVLYGITMQESGISKRVAVKLEDWPDETPEPAALAERNGH